MCNDLNKNKPFFCYSKKLKEELDSVGIRYVSIGHHDKICKGQHKYYGLHPVTNEPLVWRDLNQYDENEQIDFMSLYNPCTAKLKNKTK